MPVTLSKQIRSGWLTGESGWDLSGMNDNLLLFNAYHIDQWANDPLTTTGFTYGYRGGVAFNGSVYSLVPGSTIALAPSVTTYIQRTVAGAVSSNTVGFSPDALPMAKVVTGATGITSIEDWRVLGYKPLPIPIPYVIQDGGTAILPGVKGDLEVPFDCVIYGWTLLADQAGSIVVDVWKDSYANFPPTVADTIFGTKPALVATDKNQATGLSIAVTAGQILRFNVDSAATVKRVLLSFQARRA